VLPVTLITRGGAGMSTAARLVFAGDNENNFMAFDARTGKNPWRYPTGAPIWGAAPMTYMFEGRRHVLIATGTTLLSFVLPDEGLSIGAR
jgi:outer membrane protein assembly factor BamB